MDWMTGGLDMDEHISNPPPDPSPDPYYLPTIYFYYIYNYLPTIYVFNKM